MSRNRLNLFGIFLVSLTGIFFLGSQILLADEPPTGDSGTSGTPSAESVEGGSSESVPEGGLSVDGIGEIGASPAGEAVAGDVPAEGNAPAEPVKELTAREKAEEEAFGENQVTDIHLKVVETLELSPESEELAAKISEESIEAFLQTAELKSELAFLEQEKAFLEEAGSEGGSFARFLAQIRVLKKAELEEYSPIIAKILTDGTEPAVENLHKIQKDLDSKTESMRWMWVGLHETLVKREFLQFDLQSNRHIVTQLASMFSMDKRWFWLLGVFAFGVLIAAVWHERRHEIRRWLNGGRARQMKLAQVLTGFFTALVLMTLLSFFMGETIYRAMLDMTFSSTAPQAVYANLNENARKESQELEGKIKKVRAEVQSLQKAWKEAAAEQMDETDTFMASWLEWREAVQQIAVQSGILAELERCISEDEAKLTEINGKMASLSGDTLFFLRVKHLLRFLLGLFLAIGTFLGIACFWNDVNVRMRQTARTCPHCLTVGMLQPCDENGVQMPEGAKSANVLCTKVVQETPYEICGYRFPANLRPLTKLSFPTLGIPQVGKTHWLTMLYWEIQNRYYPKLGFSSIPSSVTEEMDRRVDEIMTYRMGTAATQRDSIPLPLVLKYKDKDPLGRTELLADIFDYSGEITTDASRDDYRRERALKSEGFLFFLDPTFPWQPQAEALKRFRKDLKSVKGLKGNESLHLPIAVCLTKIDLLPLVQALGAEAESEAIRFYEELGRIDPTGVALNKNVIEQRSALTDELRKKIWPDWDMEEQISDLFGGRYKFFPLTPVGLDGVGEVDLRQRTIAPFGLVEPLAWLLEMSGYPTLDTK